MMQVKHNKIYYGLRSQMSDNMFLTPNSIINFVVFDLHHFISLLFLWLHT